jgi:preprotein translocase subunit SecG
VYYTTEKKINEIYCQREFPLTDAQKSEITEFRSLIERVNAGGSVGSPVTLPLVGTNVTSGSASAGSVAGASTEKKSPVTVTVTPATGYAALDKDAGAPAEESLSPENRGRIAIADLLATAPSVAKDVSVETEEGDVAATATSPEEGEVLGESDKRGLLAAVAGSISSRFASCSPMTYLLSILFLLLAIVFGFLYFKKSAAPSEAVVEAKKPDEKK